VGVITKFFGFMTFATFGGWLIALFSDTETGDNPYTAWEAFAGWILMSVIFTVLRTRR